MGRRLMLLAVLAGLTSAVRGYSQVPPTGGAFRDVKPIGELERDKRLVGTWKTSDLANLGTDREPTITLVLKADGTFEMTNPAVNAGKSISGWWYSTSLGETLIVRLNHGKETLTLGVEDLSGDLLVLNLPNSIRKVHMQRVSQ